jgi:hypothetical protein
MSSRSWPTLRGAAFAVVATALLWSGVERRPIAQGKSSCNIETTERVVAIGDVHGAYDKFLAILREAGIIDGRRRWTGGRSILVQTGDIMDRGPDTREVMDLLRKLEGEAERAGGQVHALLGNHEVMRMFGDRRYASAGEYDEFKTFESEELRERAFEATAKAEAARARAEGNDFDEREFRKRFMTDNPPGSVEMFFALAPDGEYGRWLRSQDAMVKINGILYLHGGISPAVAPLGCEAINKGVRNEIKGASPPANTQTPFTGGEGPLWYRGLANGTVSPEELETILKQMDAKAIVVGHTVSETFRIRAHFDGRVIQIDTGMLNGDYYPGGVASALEVMGGTFTAIYEGRREVILPASK